MIITFIMLVMSC